MFFTPSFSRNLLRAWSLLAVAWAISPKARSAGAHAGDQVFALTSYAIDAGLPSDVAANVVQTKDGYIWVGTEGGLARFDGVRMVTFRVATQPGLADNFVRALYEDDRGVLWIGTQAGLSRWRGDAIERVAGLDRPVVSVASDGEGGVWIGTEGSGVFHATPGGISSVLNSTPAAAKAQSRVYRDSSGRVWVGAQPGGLSYVEGNELKSVALPSPDLPEVSRIYEAPKGTVWIGTSKGVVRYRDGQMHLFGKADGLREETVTGLQGDAQGRLWVVARGLYVSDDGTGENFRAVTIPNSETVRSLIQDREGTYWLGTAGNGLTRMRASAFRNIPAGGFTLNDSVRTLTYDREGYRWAAVSGRGLMRTSPSGQVSMVETGPGRDAEIWSTCGTSDGSVWIGTRGALYHWREGVTQKFPDHPSVRAIFEDSSGAVWLGAEVNGISRVHDGQFTAMAGTIGNLESTGMAFAESPKGTLWIGTNKELIRFADGVSTVYPGDSSASEIAVRAIYPERDGSLWVGTKRDGLLLFSQSRWLRAAGLKEPFNDLVSGITADDHGNLWFGTPKGVMWASRNELLELAHGRRGEGTFHLVGPADGVHRGAVGYGGQPVIWNAGTRILFATRGGLLEANPGAIAPNPIAPLVRIEQIVVDGRPREVPTAAVLPAGTRSLAIDYTAMSFVQPGAISFRYQLVGHDRDWIEARGRRTAFYTNLSPGVIFSR